MACHAAACQPTPPHRRLPKLIAFACNAHLCIPQGWDFAVEEFPDVRDWLHRMTGRPAWRNTASWNDESIAAELRAKAAA